MSRKKSILIVENEMIIAKDLEMILLNEGYNVLGIISSGEEAIKQIIELQPDLVLLDLTLRENISGIDVASFVQFHHIPVICITAHSEEQVSKEIAESGPYGYITKPFQKKDLQIAIDIALYKFKIEKKLQESEAKLKTILHTMPSGLFTIDLNKKINTWNKEAETITGLKAKETIGKLCPEILNCEDCKTGCLLFDDDVDKPIYHKESGVHINEREITLLKNEDILKDLDGNIIGGIVSFIDITEYKQAEEELRESEAKYSALVDSSKDGIIIIQDGILKFTNTASMEFLGYTPDEMIGVSFLKFVSPEYRELAIKRYTDRIEGKEVPSIYELELLRKDGSILPVELNAIQIEYEGKPVVLVHIRDITERKQAEETRQKTEKHFVEAIENIFKFVPEGLLDFTDKINLFKQNKAFQDIVKKYAVELKYTEQELTEIIIEQVKKRIINEDYADIRIPKNKNKK
ncbi:MAG: PAS domain S-box protein [FCB group bacterium]|nr:PAS domain S-box protein [FCB group bacterium]